MKKIEFIVIILGKFYCEVVYPKLFYFNFLQVKLFFDEKLLVFVRQNMMVAQASLESGVEEPGCSSSNQLEMEVSCLCRTETS